MPDKETIEKARRDAAEGKSPGTQAGEFVHAEIDHIREGKHGARSAKQAIAIGLSEARRAGVKLPPPKKGTVSEAARGKAKKDAAQGEADPNHKPSRRRSMAATKALQREGSASVSRASLSKHATSAAKSRRSAPPGKR